MSTQNFGTKSEVRNYYDWDELLKNQPEVKVNSVKGNVTDVMLPEEVESKTLVILNGEVAHLEYCLGTQYVRYISPNAHESAIYKLIQEYNKSISNK